MKEQRECEMMRRSVRRSQSAEIKKQREREVERSNVRSRQSVQNSREVVENIESVWPSFQYKFLSRCHVNSHLVTFMTILLFSVFYNEFG